MDTYFDTHLFTLPESTLFAALSDAGVLCTASLASLEPWMLEW